MNSNQFVIVRSNLINNTSNQRVGTGYFIARNLVLTAKHILPATNNEEDSNIEVRIEKDGKWIKVKKIHWRHQTLDAAILLTEDSIESVDIEWYLEPIIENLNWVSMGYPEAGLEKKDNNEIVYTSIGLEGSIHFLGGGGQRKVKKMDLTVKEHPKDPSLWKGISGAPVFVENKLIGLIESVPESFEGKRLTGIYSYDLFSDAGFLTAQEYKEDGDVIPDHNYWVLLLNGEGSNKNIIRDPLEGALEEIEDENKVPHDYLIISHDIEKILETPGQLLNYIEFICKAPVMIIDATDFQPGIMLLMGIRAVVKRGVSIVVATKYIEEQNMSKFPFNIQEIKLIRLIRHNELNAPVPKNELKKAIIEGLVQCLKNPRYLDLPAYDAVRNPIIYDISEIKEKILILCPFDIRRDEEFLFIRNKIANWTSTENIVRMIDITSPQLVGQSLYEHIRWTRKCIIDWTNWRPNVFYELGVRVAASHFKPINIIENINLESVDTNRVFSTNETDMHPIQKELLINLFEPLGYKYINKNEGKFPPEIKDYLKDREINPVQYSHKRISYDHVFMTAQKHFDWLQERVTNLPNDIIIKRIERNFGRDLQQEGQWNILYSSNKDFRSALEKQRAELLLAAWYYFINKYNNLKPAHSDIFNTEILDSIGNFVISGLSEGMYENIIGDIREFIRTEKNRKNDSD